MLKIAKNLLWALALVCFVAGCDQGAGEDKPAPMDDLGANEVVAAPGEWSGNATENSLGESPLNDFEVLNLNFPTIYFGYDSNALAPSETAKLDKVAQYINKYDLYLIIEGHCDQRGTEEYNRALGERRANAIRAYLVKRGVADNKIKTVSYGEDKPAVSGTGESVWKQNRRGVPIPMILPR